uniref:Cytokinin-O-glucosyltransferase 2 n=1 Tax=Aegilops tauschii TaxID=37682 RepID=N1QYL7_AEGTA
MLASYRVVAAIPELMEEGLISESAECSVDLIHLVLGPARASNTFLITPSFLKYKMMRKTTTRSTWPDRSIQKSNQVLTYEQYMYIKRCDGSCQLGTPQSSPNLSDDDGLSQGKMLRALDILPAQVELKNEELPWLVGDSATQKSRFAFWLRALHRARSFRSVLVNSFPSEAGGVAAAADDGHPARQGPRVFPVGPLLALGGGDSSMEQRTKGDGPPVAPCKQQQPSSMWQADSTCMGWLDRQRAASVVYVSFGSWVGPIGPEKFINCAYITRVWGIGSRLGGGMSRDEVKDCIERVMDGKEGRRLQEKMDSLRERVVTADARSIVQRNVKSFVNEIRRDYPLSMQMYSTL